MEMKITDDVIPSNHSNRQSWSIQNRKLDAKTFKDIALWHGDVLELALLPGVHYKVINT